MVTEKNDEQPRKTIRQKWPNSDEVLLAQGVISKSVDPIIGNNQTRDAYWSEVEKYYNESEPVIPLDAHNLRSHWHMFKSKVNRFNELYLQVKSRYRGGWSDDQYIQEAKQLYINDPSNKTSAAFAYEHVWNVVKDHRKYNSATHVHGFQPPKRTKNVNNEDFEVQVQHVAPTRPIGRDKAKAKLKGKAGIESSEYDMRKLKLIDEISSTNRAKSESISKFEHRIDKFYEIEEKKLEMKQKKLLLLDTTYMNPAQRAEHEAMCAEIREKYGYNRI
ncbi:glutathione S-transferase T3-like [Bidens hawaiensis]|uniref:glutathione S-transferase T3-like n=1 Tax=Bidens hawaiensis TaxID=980011 RepID=UPI0040491673